MPVKILTLAELNDLSEYYFDRTMARMEILADRGNEEAAKLIRAVDSVIDRVGTFDLDV